MLGAEVELSDFLRMYTPAQVSRIVEVPLSKVRAWIRHGLLTPARTINRLAWFEYKDILLAKGLSKLSVGGVSTAELIQSLASIAKWLPDGAHILERINAVENGLSVRLVDGGLADSTGQRLLEFESHGSARITDFVVEDNEWLARAAAAEERGDFEGAAAAYRRALEGSPGSMVYFNLGNVLFELGREGEAAESYLAALGFDEGWTEAWNNLGNALAALGKNEEAVHAYRKALEIEPEYTDAHCNIAVVLETLGRNSEAALHHAVCERAYPPLTRLRLVRSDDEC